MEPHNDTETLACDAAGIARAAALIADGQVVAVPTETVYGLAADATDADAVARIYAAKGRPGFNPLIVHVPDLAAAEALGEFSDEARAAAARWWPGPLTIVVPLRKEARVAPQVTAGLATIALRCPASPAMRDLLVACRRPLAAPSANASGAISPTTAAHVLRSLGGRIPLILDGGPTALGLESTIVAFDGPQPRLLRPGPIAIEAATENSSSKIEAPGQLAAHYAPSKPLRLNADEAAADEWLIGFGAVSGDDNLSAAGSLDEAAANLFAALHRADASSQPRIAVAPIPRHGIGAAINDRLMRAATRS